MPKPKPIARHVVYELIYGNEKIRRYTQDSPILPDVWIKYAENPHDPIDLILTPERGVSAGDVALDLHNRITQFRTETPWCYAPGDQEGLRKRTRIAHLPGVVSVYLYLDELLRLVLPATTWWEHQIVRIVDRLPSVYHHFPQTSLRLINHLAADIERVEHLGEVLDKKSKPNKQLPVDVAWALRLAGCLAMAFFGKTLPALGTSSAQTKRRVKSGHKAIAQAFLQIYNHFGNTPQPNKRAVHQVSVNRDAVGAVERSTLACKADAARLLFNVSCKDIVWAVADSGIESRHPAFHDWRSTTCGSRVIKTYDFQTLRESLSLDLVGDKNNSQRQNLVDRIFNGLKAQEPMYDDKNAPPHIIEKLSADLKEKAEEQVEGLFKRLMIGLDVDWAMLEPLVRVDQHVGMKAPVSDHGTHVAGILGADWPSEKVAQFEWPNICHGKDDQYHPLDPSKPRRMIGMCPDIKLIDLRVLRDDGRSDEFEVIAALQLIRFLNNRAGHIAVHGINLSLSIPHDVANYACGRTPVCDECDQLVADGVVVVAAAGNNGHQRYLLEGNQVRAGYNSISITDPGNAQGVVTVGATHRYRPHEYGVSYFSSRGPTGDGRRKPDLVAPGEKITAPVGRDDEHHKDGTSMAAPHVSGAAAMLMARHSELIGRPQRIKEILCATATDLGREPYFQGAGMLDILRALQSV